MKQNLGTLTPKGWNMYTDGHGRTIIYEPKTRTARIIQKEDERKLQLFVNRYALGVTAMFLLGFYVNWYVGVAVGLLIAGVLEYLYRQNFLAKMESVENVEVPPHESSVDRMAKRTLMSNIIFSLVSLALPVLMMINMFDQVKDWHAALTFADINKTLLVIASVAVSGYALYSMVCSLMAIRRILADRKANPVKKTGR